MKRFMLGVAALAVMSACSGGNPFVAGDGDGDGTTPPGVTIPEAVAGDMEAFVYDPASNTLTISGVTLDDTPFTAVYDRRPALDRPGYRAYSAQDGSLGRHTTAYVQEIDGVAGAVAMSGGQFGHHFGGASYGRDGDFDPPDTTVAGGLVHYAGNYIGMLNVAGDGGDLLPVDPGTPPEVRPRQATEVTGSIFITADFADMSVDGVVYDRLARDAGLALEDLEIAPGEIAEDGSFSGDVTQDNGASDRGDYGGIFGGRDASAVAGALFVEGHVTGVDNIEEHGLFVLGQCGTPGADPVCTQPHP